MYTGIVTGTFCVQSIVERPGMSTLIIELDAQHLDGLQCGASVGINGVCMTVTKIADKCAHFDASIETLQRTTLGQLQEGDRVNIERSARAGAEVGGHPISGHVDGMAELVHIEQPANNWVMTVKLPAAYTRYVFNKGFIALNGCSLTVSELDKTAGTFKVYVIPETLRLTTFNRLRAGDYVNFEIDRQTQIIVDTLRESLVGIVDELKAELRRG